MVQISTQSSSLPQPTKEAVVDRDQKQRLRRKKIISLRTRRAENSKEKRRCLLYIDLCARQGVAINFSVVPKGVMVLKRKRQYRKM